MDRKQGRRGAGLWEHSLLFICQGEAYGIFDPIDALVGTPSLLRSGVYHLACHWTLLACRAFVWLMQA